MHCLVVDDETRLTDLVVRYLTESGHTAEGRHDGPPGLAAARDPRLDAVLLDVMLPMNGVEVCRTLRSEGIDVPVILLTARGAIGERVAGADDYVVKPFAMQELLARLRAMSRRRPGPVGRLQVGDLVLAPEQQRAWRGHRAGSLQPSTCSLQGPRQGRPGLRPYDDHDPGRARLPAGDRPVTLPGRLLPRFLRLPVVTRLVLAVAITMSLVLTGAAALVHWRVQTALDQQLNDDLTTYRHSLDLTVRAGTRLPPGPSGSLRQVLDEHGRILRASDDVRRQPLLTPAELAPSPMESRSGATSAPCFRSPRAPCGSRPRASQRKVGPGS
ncbi:response regulator [Streptomyces sp. NPDC042638]|uniref:response regulator transcription factor n=1 Tax=Streptomyces sp. NPDC042638 TaxID=3154333 RepID=UPI00341050EE